MTTSAHKRSMGAAGVATFAALTLALTACATTPGDNGSDTNGDNNGAAGTEHTNRVVLVVHDAFPNDEFAAAASAATGYDVEVITAGDGGELSSQLVLTSAAPIADAFFGIDNTYASRLIEHDVTAPFTPTTALPERASEIAAQLLDESAGDQGAAAYPMVPVDLGATCINIDPAWFAEQGLAEPSSYEDLAAEPYRGLTVLLDPTMSSTGASFLVGTVAKFGEEGFADYWSGLAGNDPRVEQGWSDAYYGQFTQGGDGTHPIVLSYSSSPAWTLTEDGSASTTKALLDTCSSQVEYAGVLNGAANPEGAKAVVEYLLSREFQDTIADTMYMYPVDPDAYLPAEWSEFAPLPTAPHDLTPGEIAAGLDDWLRTWSDATGW